jgi:hypothetical protein
MFRAAFTAGAIAVGIAGTCLNRDGDGIAREVCHRALTGHERTFMSNAIRLIAISLMACVGVTACASHQPSPPNASGPSSTKPSTTVSTTVSPNPPSSMAISPSAPSSTPQCIGLSICPPPPPDAEGNPACYYADGWRANESGAGIEVWYFHEPQNMSKPDKVTAVVRKKDGTNESQDANIEAGQQVHRFEFPAIDKSSVQEVLLNMGSGRCFVIGP